MQCEYVTLHSASRHAKPMMSAVNSNLMASHVCHVSIAPASQPVLVLAHRRQHSVSHASLSVFSGLLQSHSGRNMAEATGASV